jgi:hypothetical protein
MPKIAMLITKTGENADGTFSACAVIGDYSVEFDNLPAWTTLGAILQGAAHQIEEATTNRNEQAGEKIK